MSEISSEKDFSLNVPPSRKGKWGRFFRWGALVFSLAAIGGYVWLNAEQFSVIRSFAPWALAPLMASHLAYMLIYGLVFREIIARLGARLRFAEYFGLTVVKNFANYMLPAHLGAAANMIYLKKRAGIPMAHFGSYFAAQTLMISASSAVCGLLGTWMVTEYLPAGSRLPYWLYAIFTAALLGLFLGVRLLPRLARFLPRRYGADAVRRFLEGVDLIHRDRRLMIRIFCFGLLGYSVASVTLMAGFAAFGISIPFKAAFLISVLGSFANYINITPANLGVQETFFALMSRVLGYGFEQGLVVSALSRAVQMVLVFSLAPYYTWSLSRSRRPAPPSV